MVGSLTNTEGDDRFLIAVPVKLKLFLMLYEDLRYHLVIMATIDT